MIPVYVLGADSNKYVVKAVSSEGHEFDVKGIKVLESDIEGLIQGLDGNIEYYAHIKALAPAQINKN